MGILNVNDTLLDEGTLKLAKYAKLDKLYRLRKKVYNGAYDHKLNADKNTHRDMLGRIIRIDDIVLRFFIRTGSSWDWTAGYVEKITDIKVGIRTLTNPNDKLLYCSPLNLLIIDVDSLPAV